MKVITNKKSCSNFRKQHLMYNKNHQLGYFSANCPDPSTSLSYWRRRFGTTNSYLNSYFLAHGKSGYLKGKFTTGRICHILHPRKPSSCNDTQRAA